LSASVIRDSFRHENLRKFMASFSGTDTLYAAIGRPQIWDIAGNDDNRVDTNVPTTSIINELLDRNDLMYAKRISASSMSFGILKNVWTAGKVYDAWRQDSAVSLSTTEFVVIDDQGDIYICLKQGKTGSVTNPSSYSPGTGTVLNSTANTFKTADGYCWKYVASSTSTDLTLFSSLNHFPVKTYSSDPGGTSADHITWVAQENSKLYKQGIYTINVTDGGVGYNSGVAGTLNVTDATIGNFKVVGDGTGIKFTVTYGALGVISDITVTDPGSGYSFAYIETAGGGAGAMFDIVYSPAYGLGVDPVKTCNALYFLATVQISSDEGGKVTVNNDYRKVCLISNPTVFGTTTLATATNVEFCNKLKVESVTGTFGPDNIIVGSTSSAKGIVIDYDAISGIIRYIKTDYENNLNPGAYASFDSVTNETVSVVGQPAVNATVSTLQTDPDVDKYSGEVIYSEYFDTGYPRNLSNEEVLKIIVEF